MYGHFLILIISSSCNTKIQTNKKTQKYPRTSFLLLIISALLVQTLFSQFQNLQSLSRQKRKAVVTEELRIYSYRIIQLPKYHVK